MFPLLIFLSSNDIIYLNGKVNDKVYIMIEKRISLQDIADKAGVSKVTVSAALKGNSGVGERKREEIRRIAQSLGYYPSAAARLLKEKENKNIALIIFELGGLIRRHSFFCDLLFRFQEECSRRGIGGYFEWSDYRAEPERIPTLLTNGLAGSFLIAGTPSAQVENFLQTTLFSPVVRIIEDGEYSIRADHRSGIREAVQYLAALGHVRIAMINGPSAFRIYRETAAAYLEALAEFGIPFRESYFAEIPEQRSAENFKLVAEKAVIQQTERPTALLLPGDGSETILYYLASKGILVPRDLSLISFATTGMDSESFSPHITSVDDSAQEFVHRGIAVLEKLRTGALPGPLAPVSSKLNIRETVLNAEKYQREENS